MDDFVSNFVAIATGLVMVEVFWHLSIAKPQNPPVARKHLGDISYTSRVIADFVSNFVAIATGLVMVEVLWHLSIAKPQNPPVARKHLGDISYTSRVIADFFSNLVAMATGVGRGKIWLASFNTPTS